MMTSLKDENVDWYNWLEKRVCVKGTLFGTLKYFGTTKFSDGLWCGVELDDPVGKNNGIVNNVKYFTCLPNFGIFVPGNKVCRIENDPKNLAVTFTELNKTVNLQKCKENTVLISTSESQPFDCNKENEEISEMKRDKTLENDPKNFGDTFMELNKTVNLLECKENTVLVSISESQLFNCNKENEKISEMKIDKTLDVEQDSDDSSLGLLDSDLVESWNSLTLDTAVDGEPDFQDALLKLDNNELNFAGGSLPTSDILFSDVISIPKYASTPRHPVKKRFTDFNSIATIDYAVENIIERNDEFESQIDFIGEDIFFDPEKFKENLNLASTSKFFQIPDASSNKNMNIVSPVSYNPILQSDNLNKTQVIPAAFIANNQDIIKPISIDLNKTQTLQNGCQATVSNLDVLNTTFKMPAKTETEDLNFTVCIKSNKESENHQKFSKVETLADTITCKNMNLNSTFDFDAALKKISSTNGTACSEYDLNQQETANICLSKTFINNSSGPQINDVNKNDSILQKTFVLDSSLPEEKHNIEQSHFVDVLDNVEFKSFDYKNKLLEETAPLENTLTDVKERNSVSIPPITRNRTNCTRRFSYSCDLKSTIKTKGKVISNDSVTSKNQRNVSSLQLKTNNVDKKTAQFKKPLPVYSSIRKSKAPLKKSTSAKENSSYLKENVFVNSDKPVVSGVIHKNVESSIDIKLEIKRKSGRIYSNAIPSKSTVSSHKFSYSKTAVQLKTTGNLSLQNNDDESSKISNKILVLGSEVLPMNNINVPGTSKVSLNSVKNTMPGEKTVNQTSNNLTKNPIVINLNETVSFDMEPKNNQSSDDLKLEQEKERVFSSIEDKSVLPNKSLVSSRRFSYSESIKTTVRSNILGNLPKKVSGSSKISSKINFSASKAVPKNDSSVQGTSQVPNKNTLLPKKIINQTYNGQAKNSPVSQFKEQVVKDKLLTSRQSFGLSSNGRAIPRRDSLVIKSKSNLPAGRYSMLPSIKENICEAKSIGEIEQLAKSNDHFVPGAVPKVIADSSQSSRIASSLPQKSQISTRKMGQKYSDVKEENSASPKIPRYNLRRKN
ncbi:restin homolog [Parasteatoda tepidariorum]|uniref:restin homolog n=1 Tax=Parasteatoda tepidariorum TaxID=114398 RepID=UPI001C71BB3B|nr:restin homolog [Parasteatoda tepidariorum]XP_015927995.2 restin homolog [Parasteatoda tepidariorum]XP_015927996.2 restin homolog [Parasteatoda tepidariorum]XP_015927997.2 restin homolog [Parasteatoda tepidariorum]XP_015928000.2 restin homolog [Parasteatoda tepidariorum]XP_015928001.2 restin homolog [Parasteatoda tepidariorum]